MSYGMVTVPAAPVRRKARHQAEMVNQLLFGDAVRILREKKSGWLKIRSLQEKLKDILAHLSQDIDQETLLLYLQEQLSPERQHELEKQLLDNPFAGDALEGLRQIKDKKQIAYMVEMLNRDLRKKTEKRKLRRRKLNLPDNTQLYLTVAILLFLIVICFVVIWRMRAQ